MSSANNHGQLVYYVPGIGVLDERTAERHQGASVTARARANGAPRRKHAARNLTEGVLGEAALDRPHAKSKNKKTMRASRDGTAASEAVDTSVVATRDTQRLFRFSYLFPERPAFIPDPAGLEALGAAMADTGQAILDNPRTSAGFTYLGQFIDHDITFDEFADLSSDLLLPNQIRQGRSPSLDLDSLYGRGPSDASQGIYAADGVHMRVGMTAPVDGLPSFPNDLPRGHAASNPIRASIGDPRNDENLAVAQTHLAFIKFHNTVVDQLIAQGTTSRSQLFDRARDLVTRHYQWIVLNDFLPKIVDPLVLKDVLTNGRKFYEINPLDEPAMPLEFAVAAYRFGHSMIRDGYFWNRVFDPASLDLLFLFTGPGSLAGGDALPSNWVIDWTRFYDFSVFPGFRKHPKLNPTRLIDTSISPTLLDPAVVQVAPNLATRNLLRGRKVQLPSGQDVAKAVGAPLLSSAILASGSRGTVLKRFGFEKRTPLWFYFLKEAAVQKKR
jgi:hypothetical protein